MVVCFHRAYRCGGQLLPTAAHAISLRCGRGGGISERLGGCFKLVFSGSQSHDMRCYVGREPDWWRPSAIASGADPESVRMAGLLGVWWYRSVLGHCVVHLVSRLSNSSGSVNPIDANQPTKRPGAVAHKFPWRAAFRSQSALALLATAFCYVYVFNFFQTWFHTFLQKGRGFSETGLLLSSLPFVVAAIANLTGGRVSDALVSKLGLKQGRRVLGVTALTTAGVFTIAAMLTQQQILTVAFLSVVYGSITFQQSVVFGVCLDIANKNAGAMVGMMNTAAQLGGLVGSVAYGYIVDHFDSYNAPFVPMAVLLFLGASLWFRIDASKKLYLERRGASALLEA